MSSATVVIGALRVNTDRAIYINKITNGKDQAEATHNELPHLDLKSLTSSFQISNEIASQIASQIFFFFFFFNFCKCNFCQLLVWCSPRRF